MSQSLFRSRDPRWGAFVETRKEVGLAIAVCQFDPDLDVYCNMREKPTAVGGAACPGPLSVFVTSRSERVPGMLGVSPLVASGSGR